MDKGAEEYITVCAASFFLLAFNMGALMNVRPLVLLEALKLAGSTEVKEVAWHALNTPSLCIPASISTHTCEHDATLAYCSRVGCVRGTLHIS